jgi:CheY-like chemotaxis protein
MGMPTTEVRVLVVDDQVAYRRALAAVVAETDGFLMVAETTSGEESLVIAAEVHPDLVLMDVNLPGISGIDAARRLTPDPAGPVVVLLSTYDEDEFDLEGCGASAYVAKAAFAPERLSEVWSAAVHQRGRHPS